MNREELIYLIPYILSLALSLGVFIYAWRRQTVAGARPFAWLAATQAAWTFCFILELIIPTLSGKLLWDAFQWLGAIVLPLIFPAFTIEYAHYQIKRARLFWGSLAAFPLILLILVLTSGYHKLLYPNPHLVPGEPFSSLSYDFTVLFWVAALYAYAIIIGCMIVLLRKFGRSVPLYRSQVFIIAFGAAFPILVTFLPLIGINITPQRDPTPFTFAIGNLIIALGLFRYHLLDLVPIARERVLENMTDVIIVLDASNRVVDMNRAALVNVGQTSPEVIGRPAQEVFAAWPELKKRTQNLDDAAPEVSALVQGEYRIYDLSISSIRDQRNRLIGRVFVAHDITARKILEERYRLLSEELEQRVLERTENLRVSESRLQAAINASDIVLWERDLLSGHITWLGHYEKLLGFAPGELADNTLASFESHVHPEDIEGLRRRRQRALEERSEYRHEYRVVWRDGSIHWIRAQGRFTYDEHGQPARLSGAVLDITERKQAEEALRTSERVLREAESLGHTGSWEQDLVTGEIFNTDENLRLFFGNDRSKGTNFADYAQIVHPDDRAYVLQRRAELLEEEGPGDIEYRIVWPDGSVHVIFGRATIVRNEAGQPIRVYGTNVDISERKQAEEEIQRYAARMEELAEISRTFVEVGLDYQIVLDAVVRRTAALIGDACVMTLFSEDQQRAYPVAFHHPNPESRALMHNALLHTWHGGTDTERFRSLLAGESSYLPVVNQEAYRAATEPEFWPFVDQVGISSVLIVPLQARGHVIGTLGLTRDRYGSPYTTDDQVLLQDIADRAALAIQNARLFEQVEGARERLEALSHRLLEVQEAERRALTMELHDRVGQNLTGLSINLQNLKASLSREEARALAAKFDDAQALVEDTSRQIRDIMAELHLPELEDYGLAAALEIYAERAAARGNLELLVDLPDLDPPRLPSDLRATLFRAAQEAISNVLKHANATQLGVRLDGRNGRICLKIEDNGQGFEPDVVSQKERQTWGLQIMRERMESIGGKVFIESKPGQGTGVIFEIERPS